MRIFSIAKRINKKITIQKAENNDNKSSSDQASFLTESYSFDLPFFWKFTYIPRYVRYFNSFEAVELPLVTSTLYQYNNASTLYRETRLKTYLINRFIEKADQLYYSWQFRKVLHPVSVDDLRIATNIPLFAP